MEIIGRVTKDATVTKLKDGRQVVNFGIAMNDKYKPKGIEQPVKVTTYINCSYWINPGIAAYLTKGSLVELYGRIGVSVWKNPDGEAKGSLNFHVNNIKLHGKNKSAEYIAATDEQKVASEPVTEDLPF